MHKVVFDTNQFVSSIIAKNGIPAQLLQAWRESAYILITCTEILQELRRVLQYPHITKKYHLTETDINSLFILIHIETITPAPIMHIHQTPGE